MVANPTNGDGTNSKFGSSGGTVLGTPTSATLEVLGTTPDTSNIKDLTYVFAATTSDPFAIRIGMHNAFTQNGTADAGAPVNGGTNARFTQGNWDNVRLEVIPEPASVALVRVPAGTRPFDCQALPPPGRRKSLLLIRFVPVGGMGLRRPMPMRRDDASASDVSNVWGGERDLRRGTL